MHVVRCVAVVFDRLGVSCCAVPTVSYIESLKRLYVIVNWKWICIRQRVFMYVLPDDLLFHWCVSFKFRFCCSEKNLYFCHILLATLRPLCSWSNLRFFFCLVAVVDRVIRFRPYLTLFAIHFRAHHTSFMQCNFRFSNIQSIPIQYTHGRRLKP